MAAGNLLTLIDDIAIMLDDVAVMTKAAVRKTAGVGRPGVASVTQPDLIAANATRATGNDARRQRAMSPLPQVGAGRVSGQILVRAVQVDRQVARHQLGERRRDRRRG